MGLSERQAGFGAPKRLGQSFVDLSHLVTEPLRTDEEFILYRGEQSSLADSPSVLLLAPASRPALETLKKIETRILVEG